MFPATTGPLAVDYDRYSLRIDGRRELIRSGAIHYFRLPSPDLWWDRLYKLKAAGYNTVDLYFCWDYHCPAPGVYDFTGIRDVDKLLQMTQDLGLYLIARPGPYINAEYTGGGLPGWLIADHEVVLRNRREDGTFEWSEPYMQAVRDWWGQIVPKIVKAPNLILMQIENEYATAEMEPDYMQALYQMSRDLGVQVPLFHNDMYAMGLYEDVVDIYAFDNYSVTHFDTNWRKTEGVFSVLDYVEQSMRPYCQNRPLMVAELQAGWFGAWKGYNYKQIIEGLGRDHISLVTKSLLGQGLTIFNHYKAIGGTNWGYMGSTDTFTSYDFGAPISEPGLNTERLYEAKALNLFLGSFDLTATDAVSEPPMAFSNAHCVYGVRQSTESPGAHWIFLRNLEDQPTYLTLDSQLEVRINPSECLILPYHVPLACGAVLEKSNAECLYQNRHALFLKANRPVELYVKLASSIEKPQGTEKVHVFEEGDGCYRITCPELPGEGLQTLRMGELSLYLLGQHLIDTFWLEEAGRMVIGPPERLPEGGYGITQTSNPVYVISPQGELAVIQPDVLSEKPLPSFPLLGAWEAEDLSAPLYSVEGFIPSATTGSDFDSNGFYEGSAWYRYSFEGTEARELSLEARHIWAVFLNGQFLREGHSWVAVQGEAWPPPQQIQLPSNLLRADQPNELVIFVDGLGHPKGFHDDARTPQGLLSLALDGIAVTHQVQIMPGLLRSAAAARQAAPIVRYRTEFTMPDLADLHCPLGLCLKDLDAERVNLYLNGTLIGRHWRACQNQETYYLPDGILKTGFGEQNRIELVLMNFDPLLSVSQSVPQPQQVLLQPYGVFTKVRI